ncbi:MAG: hypothetical protein [Wendovervirus sonii]|uniref:Major capsid protein n=1 Tax=phage Lak_Megaphage_Sonny TaxID=3109229 RepID=A0ABZ0Z6U7_9CAUD|nr:MAG: hypothetical protein [phage Lak_Megaphage_Sonny]
MKVNNSKSLNEAYAALDAKANSKDANKLITEQWGSMIERTTGVKDPEKLEWMSQLAHFTAKSLNEDAQQFVSGGNNPASAYGGVYSPYNTLYNTTGVGNVVPAGRPAMTGSAMADDRFNGSGDKFPAILPLAMKVAAKTVGFELVNNTPLAGPSGVLPYMDYIYSGSKQPYGATPAFSPETANPYWNAQKDGVNAYTLYSLPSSFKAALCEDHTYGSGSIAILKTKIELMKKGLQAGVKFATAGEKPLTVEFIGWSRIDGDPMYKVVSGSKSLGEYFADNSGVRPTLAESVEFTQVVAEGETPIKMSVRGPKMISMLEDNILGYTGAGENDADAWMGTYQDGMHLYEPMLRGTGEQTPARQISLQLFTKNIQVGTIQIACAVTQEQVTDLSKQWGIDVVKIIENAAINDLSQTINRHITSRLFGLGWKNHAKLVEVEGLAACLNMSFINEDITNSPAFAIPAGNFNDETQSYEREEQVSLPVLPFSAIPGANFENRDTLIKRIFTNILAASNWIQQRGRYGAATFVVTNIRIATLLQSDAHYAFSPIENTLSQAAGQLYPIGKVCGLTVYVDPLMNAADNRVLVGRKGAKDEPGTHFCPYVMAEVYRTISEATMAPKLMVKSRYALIDAGFFPETQYLTFWVDARGL